MSIKGKKSFCRNKAVIVSHSKDFLLNSIQQHETLYQKYGTLYGEQGRRERENYLSQRSILQTLQASLLSFYEMFHGYCIILACIFHFYILFCTLYKRSDVVRNFLLLTQNIKPKENDSIVHKINILP